MPPEGVSRFAANLRSEVRHIVEQPAAMRVHGVKGGAYLVTVLDVSRGGLRASSPSGFPIGTQVEISVAQIKVSGEIRYAREVDSGQFHLGIQVAAGQESDLLKRLNLPL